MPEFVTIKHPDQESTGRSSREAFEKVWKDKGFELVDEEEADQPVTAAEPEETSVTTSYQYGDDEDEDADADED